ncbi:MAG: serine/threonine protein kinase [Sandaracinus sp.]|nr:serine/threonine protein kinase [Sandaracinus sp.]MCB9637194.1 serine/threonine protein kinase [Sandaracinus sp.]
MELQRGQSLAGYEIVSHVKSGGMAALYLARRRGAAGFQRPVAIKVVHPHLARDPKFVRMFLDEARLAVRIQHPNVVRVEELLEAEGTYLMVMEYVHGCSLYDLLRALAKAGRRLSPDLAAWIGIQISDGLHAAHELKDERGQPLDVVHRDVSPQNVLLSWDGHVKVIDFGIAKSRSQAEQTRVGVIRGKVGYMSPEQANAGQLDRRTDVYALGVVLWEMLTSRRLFRAENEIKLLDMVRFPQIPPPSQFGAVPPPLEEVILDALRPDADRRLPSAKALRDRLLHAQPGAGSVHSSNLAGLLATVLGDKIEESPIAWSEAFSVEQVDASTSHLANHTMAASASIFADDLEEIEDDAPLPTAAGLPRRRLTSVPPPPPRPRAPTPVPGPGPRPRAPTPIPGPPPDDRPNTFAQFSQPPPADGPVAKPPAAPSAGSQILVSLVSLLVLGGALALAGYLLWQAGAFDELLNDAPAALDGDLPDGGVVVTPTSP